MSSSLQRLALFFIFAFSAMAFGAGYWGFAASDSLLTRDDNPRRVLLERRVQRGSIYDRNDIVLVESIGTPGDYTRMYHVPSLAPVVGYHSPFYGSAGIESTYDAVLHGDAGRTATELEWGNLLGAPSTGRAVKLTIDSRLQTIAEQTLGTRTGAIVLLDALTGDLLALVSSPTYDPNQLEDQWSTLIADPRAPLLNRATLALYQPGSAMYPIILGAALQARLTTLKTLHPNADESIAVGNLQLPCRTTPPTTELAIETAFKLGCPWPFADLGGQLGRAALTQLFTDFRLLTAPTLGIPTTAARSVDLNSEADVSAIGQGSLTLTPLHLALVTAALARRGQLPAARLVSAVQDAAGTWQPVATTDHIVAAFTPDTADQVKALMRGGYTATAVTNAAGQHIAWYSDFAPYFDSRYAVVVLLEDGDTEAAANIGRAILQRTIAEEP